MKAKKLLSVLLALTMVLSLLPMSALAASYEDAKGHWAEAAIERWSDYGIVTGDERGFRPNDNMTRAEAAKVLSELFGLTSTAGAATFTDVPADAWYADYIAKANAAGIMGGVGDNQANPNGTLTRETFFVMFARGLGLKEQSTTSGVAADGDSWANGYINALTDKGYVKGDGTGVNALANINRASVMSLLDQTITQYVNESGTVTLTADKGIVLVNAKNVTLTGTTNADVVIAKGASGSSVAFSKATVNGAVTVQADNAKVTADKDSKLAATPVVNGAGSTYTDAKGTSVSGGGGSTPTSNTTTNADWYIDPNAKTTTIASTAEGAGLGSTVDGNVRISAALAEGDLTLSNIAITGDLIIEGGGNSSITLNGVTIGGHIVFAKTSGNPAQVKADGSTTVAQGVIVNSTSTGAILNATATGADFGPSISAAQDVKLVASSATTFPDIEVTGTDVTINASDSNSAVETVKVAENASANIAGTDSKVKNVEAKGDVVINSTLTGTVTASGTDTEITIASGKTVPTLAVTEGSATISGSGATITNNIAVSGGNITVTDATVATKQIDVTGTATVTADNGVSLTKVKVAENANATLASGSNGGGSVATVETKGNVAVNTNITTKIEVEDGAPAVTVTVANDAEITKVEAKSAAGVTVDSASTGGSVGTLEVTKGSVAVNGANAEISTLEVKNSSATTTVTVTKGTINKIDATNPVKVEGSSTGTVAQVTGTTTSISVDSAVVETVTPASGANIQVSGNSGIEIDATGTSGVTVAATNGASAANIDVTSSTGTPSETVSINGQTAAAQPKSTTPTASIAIESGKRVVTVSITTSATSVVTLYSDAAASREIEHKDAGASAANVKFTLDDDFAGTVYATVTETGKKESAAAAATFTPIKANQATIYFDGAANGSDVWGSAKATEYDASKLFNVTPSSYEVVSTDTAASSYGSGEAKGDGKQIAYWDSNDHKLIVTRKDATTTADSFSVAIKATAANGTEATVTIVIGATTQPTSPTPVATLNATNSSATGQGNNKLLVKLANGGNMTGKINVYATSAASDTAKLATEASPSGVTYQEITLTAQPAGNVWVEYTATGMKAAARVLTSGYAPIAKATTGDDTPVQKDVANAVWSFSGSSVSKVTGDFTGSASDYSINFANYVTGGSGSYAYAVSSNASWLEMATNGTLTATVPAQAVAATPVTVTITDKVSNESIQYNFTVEVSSSVTTALSAAKFGDGSQTGTSVDNTKLTVTFGENAVAGDVIKIYADAKTNSTLGTITLAEAQKTDSGSSLTIDLAKLNIKLAGDVYVTHTAGAKTESPRVATSANDSYKYNVLSVTSASGSSISTTYGNETEGARLTFTASYGIADYTYSVTPALPAGLTLNQVAAVKDSDGNITTPAKATITGTPTEVVATARTYTVIATDAVGSVAMVPITIQVAKASQDAPTGVTAAATKANGYATLSNVTDKMEYTVSSETSLDATKLAAATWNAITGTTAEAFIGVAASSSGTTKYVYVRYAETDTKAVSNCQDSKPSQAEYVPAATPTVTLIIGTTGSLTATTVERGGTLTLTGTATEGSDGATSGSFSYKWYKNGAEITSAAGSEDANKSYTVTATDNATKGTYTYEFEATYTVTGDKSKTVKSEPVTVNVIEKTVAVSGTVKVGSSGQSGVTLKLYDATAPDGNALATATSSTNGAFTFSPNVAGDGSYIIKVEADSNGTWKDYTSPAAISFTTNEIDAAAKSDVTVTLEAATLPVYTVTFANEEGQNVKTATVPLKGADALTLTYKATVTAMQAGAEVDNFSGKATLSIPTTTGVKLEKTAAAQGEEAPDTWTLTVDDTAKAGVLRITATYETSDGGTVSDATLDVEIKANDTAVAEVNGREYATLANAVTAANGSGEIVLLKSAKDKNVSIDEDVSIGKDVTLNIPEGVTLNIPENKTLTVAGTLVVNGDVDLKGKLLIASLDSISTKKAFTIAAGSELYVGTSANSATAIIGKSDLNGSAGTALSAGKVTVDVGAKTVTIGDGTTATTAKVFGWPNDWAAVIESGATVTLASLEKVANVEKDITVKAGGVLNVVNGNSTKNIFGANTVTEGTSLSTGLVKLNVKNKTVTIGGGATPTTAAVAGWPNDWAAVIESNATVTLDSLVAIANVTADITVKAGANLEIKNGNKIFFGTDNASAKEGTYLAAGSVTLRKSDSGSTATFSADATGTIYGWPEDWTASVTEGGTITVREGLTVSGISDGEGE